MSHIPSLRSDINLIIISIIIIILLALYYQAFTLRSSALHGGHIPMCVVMYCVKSVVYVACILRSMYYTTWYVVLAT
jgi:hypothetical protein